MATDTQLEREYYIRKLASSSVGPQTPLSSLQRRYWSQVVGNVGTNVSLPQLEYLWLLKEIANRGGTPTADQNTSSLYKILVSRISQTPSVRLTENKRLFFKFAS